LVESAALRISQGDNSRPESPAEGPEYLQPRAIERRVWRNGTVVVGLAVLVAAPIADFRVTLGLALGGGLALFNYRWLHSSVRDVLGVGSRKVPPGTYLKFIVRWLVVAGIAWLGNRTGYFDATAIIAGLFAPALAIMLEAGYTTIKALTQHDGER
jgi:hypothetical protein